MQTEEYVKGKGLNCLICGSDALKPLECGVTDHHDITQKIECEDCSNTWTDVYKLNAVICEGLK